MRPQTAAVLGILSLALVPAAQADPLHVYTDLAGDARVGVQEHLTSAGAGAWVETDAEGVELHVRLFFTHCIADTADLPNVVCAV